MCKTLTAALTNLDSGSIRHYDDREQITEDNGQLFFDALDEDDNGYDDEDDSDENADYRGDRAVVHNGRRIVFVVDDANESLEDNSYDDKDDSIREKSISESDDSDSELGLEEDY